MPEIPVDTYVSEVKFKTDAQSFRQALDGQRKLTQQAIQTKDALDKTTRELEGLTREEGKAGRATIKLRRRKQDLTREIKLSGRATKTQRLEMLNLDNALTKTSRRHKDLRDQTSRLRREQAQLRRSMAQTTSAARRLGAAVGDARIKVRRGEAAGRIEAARLRGERRAEAGRVAGAIGGGVSQAAAGGARAGAIAVGATAAVGVPILQQAAEFERLQAQLVAVTGSQANATRAFKDILEIAKDTPFQVQNITAAYARLQAVGIKPTTELITSLSNTSAANSKDILDFAEAIADASTGEFERLKEFGIVARSSGDQVALTFDGVTKTVGKNKDEITAFLKEIGETRFAGAAIQQMDTIGGRVSNLQDQFGQLALAIGEAGASKGLKDVLSLVAETLGDEQLVEVISEFIESGLRQVAEVLRDIEERGGVAPRLRQIFSALDIFRKVVVAVVKAGLGLLEFFDKIPGGAEAATAAIVAFAAAGGGLPGLFLAAAAAGGALGEALFDISEEGRAVNAEIERLRGQLADVSEEVERARKFQEGTDELGRRVEAETKRQLGERVKRVEEASEEIRKQEIGGLGAGLVVEGAAGFRAGETQEERRQRQLTAEGQRVQQAIDIAAQRRVSQAEQRARSEARRAGQAPEQIEAAAASARRAAESATRQATTAAREKATKEFQRTGSAAAAAKVGAAAVSGEKRKRGGGGRGAAGREKRATSPIEALQQALQRPPVINVTNIYNNVTGNEFQAIVRAQLVGQTVASLAQGLLGELRRGVQQIFAEALPSIETTRVR